MGQVHHQRIDLGLDKMLSAPVIVLAARQGNREELVREDGLSYRIVIEQYFVIRTLRGDIAPNSLIGVYSPLNKRFRRFARDELRNISRHPIERVFVPPKRDYPRSDKESVLLLNYGNLEGIYDHSFGQITLPPGWYNELEQLGRNRYSA